MLDHLTKCMAWLAIVGVIVVCGWLLSAAFESIFFAKKGLDFPPSWVMKKCDEVCHPYTATKRSVKHHCVCEVKN